MVGCHPDIAYHASSGGPCCNAACRCLLELLEPPGLHAGVTRSRRALCPSLQAVPGTSQLMIVMELMAASAADLVSQGLHTWHICSLSHG